MEGYQFLDAGKRLATIGEGLQAAVEGLGVPEPQLQLGASLTYKAVPSELGVPLLPQK